ncbi:permease [Chachezhania antarctica]|uniref:permease n=1 Tax=Chachezhania antarctica TaxID=2340860 RepID=UPI001F09F61D|nr:permease [Chachezhania antarctica]
MDQMIEAFTTGAGMLWKALWALIFGYIISAGIQIFVTRDQMARVLGDRGARKAGCRNCFAVSSKSSYRIPVG